MTWANLDKNGQHCESVQICDDPTKFQARLRIVENCEGGSHLGSNRTFVRWDSVWDTLSTRESFNNLHFRSLSVGDGSYNLGAPGGPNSHNASDAGLAKDFPSIWEVLPKILSGIAKILRGLSKDFERSCQRFSSNLWRTVHFIVFVSVESLLLLGQRPVFATDNQVPITNHQSPGTTTNHHPKPLFCYYPSAPLNF